MGEWRAGVASEVITPSESMWMAGYAARRSPSTGVEADLFVKALALEDARGRRAVIVASDLIAISREIADVVAAEVTARFAVSRESLLLSSSHTHCGPEVRPGKAPFFHIPAEFAEKIQPFADRFAKQCVSVIGAALGDLRPARISAHQATATFAVNRRDAGEFFDHAVPVLRVTDAGGATRAVLFGYACHNTTLRPEFVKFCGDYAGFAQGELEEEFPGSVAMFMAGAGADQNPEPLGSLEIAKQHGQTLARAVNEAIRAGGAEVGPRLSTAFEDVMLDFQPIPSVGELKKQATSDDLPVRTKANFLLRELSERELEKQYPCPVQVFRLGNEVTLVAIGGEPVSDFAIMLRKEFAPDAKLVWVAGYCNDMFGYVPTVRVQRQNSYEGGRAMLWAALPMPFTETVEDRVMNAARKLVESVKGRHGSQD